MRLHIASGEAASVGIGTKILLSLFFLFFLGMGSAFTVFVVRSFAAAVATYTWQPTACQIIESRAGEAWGRSEHPYTIEVLYRYEFGDHRHESRVFKSGYGGSDQISDAQHLANRYPSGSAATCYVDPSAPERSCLERASLWFGLFIFLPLIFVLVGGIGLVAVWRTARPGTAEASTKAISEKATSSGKAVGCVIAFFSIFLLAGVGTSLFFLRPAFQNLAARSWPEVPCVVLSSAVRSHSGNNGTTYSVDILYEYEVGERTYRSNRYHFLGGSSGGYDSKAAIVAKNPPGTRRVCYVNPADPTEAVLTRSFEKDYLVAIVPVIFAGAGLGGILIVLKGKHRPSAAGAGTWTGGGFAVAEDAAFDSGPMVLKAPSPLAKLLGMIFLAVFWNGIVSVFFWQMVKGWKSGAAPVGLTIFLIPFVLIGLAFIVGVGYSFLALFNPRPRVTLSRSSIPLGGSAALEWRFAGRASRITRVTIRLEGREEASYRRGTTTETDRNVFARIPVFDAPGDAGAQGGQATLAIPSDTMHSFEAPDNKIIWTLKFTGEIPNWPDVSEEFVLNVRPQQSGGAE